MTGPGGAETVITSLSGLLSATGSRTLRDVAAFIVEAVQLDPDCEVFDITGDGDWDIELRVDGRYGCFFAYPFALGDLYEVALELAKHMMTDYLEANPDIEDDTVSLPQFGTDFPAEHVVTEMEWDDVVLRPGTREQLRDIERWVVFNDTVLHEWGMRKRVRPGCRVLFHGPPGTGKTLAATLIGKSTDRPVFRIDLSRVVSRYIGETEKNLARLLDKAEHKDWILFFDEADALFGERSKVRDANDKYANQEVAFLLQRIENFAGLVILAANRRGDIDPAFIRRLRYVVEFPTPNSDDRLELWRRVFPEQLKLAEDVDWSDVAQRYELSAASIVNVAHHCAIVALGLGELRVDAATLEAAISRELVKDGKVE